MSRRAQQLVDLVAEFLRVHEAYVEDDNQQNPNEVYWDALTAVLDSFAEGEIPASCRELADAVDRLRDEFEVYDNRHEVSVLYPHQAFWSARAALASLFERSKARELPPLESIAQLDAQKVSHRQIAQIYGFIDGQGRVLAHLVQKELDSPGSILKAPGAIDGRDWRDPRVPVDESPAERHHSELLAKREAIAADDAAPCPESARDLWEQGVSVSQAAKMLKQDASVVALAFAEFDAAREAELAGGDIFCGTTQAIRELHEAGKTAKQIQDELKVSAKQVKEALAKVAA